MSLQDPISDMFTRIRNAHAVAKKEVSMPSSTLKCAIAEVLKTEGYITGFTELADGPKKQLTVELKYYEGRPVIEMIKRVSRPGLRIYKEKNELPVVENGLGIAIISTSKGVMSSRNARKIGHGGEVLAEVC